MGGCVKDKNNQSLHLKHVPDFRPMTMVRYHHLNGDDWVAVIVLPIAVAAADDDLTVVVVDRDDVHCVFCPASIHSRLCSCNHSVSGQQKNKQLKTN